jgi:small subunit ribosomal protein S20e
MAEPSYEKGKGKGIEAESKPQKIRFTLTSTKLAVLESMTSKLIASAKKENLKVIGPVRHPNKILRITVRRSPCGNGTQTFDRFEMRIHKRVVNLICPAEYIKKVTDFTIEPGVEVELHFTDV